MFPEAIAAHTRACEEHWHNPSSLYREAGAAKRLLEEARERLADILGIEEPNRIVFTSGATEANNLVMAHAAASAPGQSAIISEIEHPSVLEPARKAFGERLRLAKVQSDGALDLAALEASIQSDKPALISVMAANNETGAIQPWIEAAELSKDIQFHCDAAQWLGKMPSDGLATCDWITGSAHKFGGPKGAGFLVVPEDLDSIRGGPIGGPQERGLRAGTENYPAVAAMLAALERAQQLLSGAPEIENARDGFEARILAEIPNTRVCGAGANRLWNTTMLVLPAHRNLKWLTRLSHFGFQVSTGSACSSGKENPSHVMQAMGLSFDEMGRVLRLSAGWQTSAADWKALGDALIEVWSALNSTDRESKPKIQFQAGAPSEIA